MIIAHNDPSCSPAVATIHLVPIEHFDVLAERALRMLREICGRGVAYRIVMGGRERIGFT